MTISHRPSLVASVLLVAVATFLPTSSGRADDASSALGEPIGVFNVASVERVLDDASWTFASAGRTDLDDVVGTVLATVNDLKGLDRTKPLGVMAFLAPTGNGRPLVVGYVPVTDLDELMQSLTIGPLRPVRVPNKDGVWKFENPEGGRGALYAAEQSGYAFFTDDPGQLEITFPNPERVAKNLVARYDVAGSLNLEGIPPGLRFLATAGLRAMTSSERNRKPGETDEQFQLRTRVLDGLVKTAESFLNEGRDVTWGLEFSEKRREILVEFAVNAREGTALAKRLEEFHVSPRLDALRSTGEPVSFSLAVPVEGTMHGLWEAGVAEARKNAVRERPEVAGLALDFADGLVADDAVEIRLTTAGGPPRGLVGVMGARMKNAASLTERLARLAKRATEQGAEFEPNVFVHRDVTFSRFRPAEFDREDSKRLYGPGAGLYVGGSDDVLWMGIGGPNAVAAVKAAMDRVAEGPAESASEVERPPVLAFEASATTLMLLSEERNPEFEALSQKAFLDGADRLMFAVGPKKDGFSARFTAEEGFVRLLGLGIAKAFDDGR